MYNVAGEKWLMAISDSHTSLSGPRGSSLLRMNDGEKSSGEVLKIILSDLIGDHH